MKTMKTMKSVKFNSRARNRNAEFALEILGLFVGWSFVAVIIFFYLLAVLRISYP